MEEIYRYAYEYRNPQGLRIILDEMGISREEARGILEAGLISYGGKQSSQYNFMTGTYQTLPEWVNWFLNNWNRVGEES